MVVFIGQYAQPRAKSRSFLMRLVVVGDYILYRTSQGSLNEVPQQQGSWPLHLHHLAPPVFNSAFSMRGSHVWPF